MFDINLNRAKRKSVNKNFSYKPFLIITSFFIIIFILLKIINAYNMLIMIVKKNLFLFYNL